MRISDWSSDVCSSDVLIFRATQALRGDDDINSNNNNHSNQPSSNSSTSHNHKSNHNERQLKRVLRKHGPLHQYQTYSNRFVLQRQFVDRQVQSHPNAVLTILIYLFQHTFIALV